jgi:hypothetical protein
MLRYHKHICCVRTGWIRFKDEHCRLRRLICSEQDNEVVADGEVEWEWGRNAFANLM